MNTAITIGRNIGSAFAVLMFAMLPFAPVQAADLGGYTYYPSESYTYYPSYESSYTYYPSESYSYYPSYESSYTYYPSESYTYYPSESYTYYPSESYTYYPSYSETSYDYNYDYSYDYDYDYNYGSYYSYNYDYDYDHGCKKNCGGSKPKPKPVCALDISPSRVDYGDDAEIHWTSENATSATLTGFGSVSTGGSRDIENIKSDKTYTLTVKGPGGTATCSDSIKVEKQEKDLECKLRASDTRIERGDSVRISWSSEGADYGRISPEIGRVDEDGSETVRLYEDTEFEGTFYNDDGDKVECDVEVDVEKEHIYIPPQTPYVTLSQVPYTGFELGPVGTAIYWTLLAAWCLIAAYLIAVKKAHVALARRLNTFLFGSTAVTVTPVHVAPLAERNHAIHGHVHTAHAAHDTHTDATDEFVLSQLNRGKHSH